MSAWSTICLSLLQSLWACRGPLNQKTSRTSWLTSKTSSPTLAALRHNTTSVHFYYHIFLVSFPFTCTPHVFSTLACCTDSIDRVRFQVHFLRLKIMHHFLSTRRSLSRIWRDGRAATVFNALVVPYIFPVLKISNVLVCITQEKREVQRSTIITEIIHFLAFITQSTQWRVPFMSISVLVIAMLVKAGYLYSMVRRGMKPKQLFIVSHHQTINSYTSIIFYSFYQGHCPISPITGTGYLSLLSQPSFYVSTLQCWNLFVMESFLLDMSANATV